MRAYPIYPHAPITEAIIDFRCELPKTVSLETLEHIHEHVIDLYPEKTKRMSFIATIQVPPGEAPEELIETSRSEGKPDGFFFRTAQNDKIFQARLDGFSANKLPPYESGESFIAEAKRLWEIYCEHVEPIQVTRVALRYINKIMLPLPFDDFKEFILTGPELSPNIKRGLSSFFTQFTIPYPEMIATAIVNETIEQAYNNCIPLIFDIDVFRIGSFSPSKQEIWDILDNLRQIKNEIFFESLTDKARGLFV